MADDQQWMELAIAEARKGIGLTSPNPTVGAVIVKNDQILGKGWHRKAGQPHAEREAIADVTEKHGQGALVGSTIYVTLEPCSTRGRTPACTDGILEAGISRVVYGSVDPNPAHAGQADEILAKQGVEVSQIADRSACDKLIQAFSKVQRTGLPWVILKSAMSLDGRITRPLGESQWLTSPDSRKVVQRLRFESDAILTGGRTLRIDDPALTIRDDSLPKKPQPWRLVITQGNRDKLPTDAKVFNDAHAERTLVQENGDMEAALRLLVEKGCNTVLVEAGGTLMGSFLDAGLADEVVAFYAPMLTGGPDAGFSGLPKEVCLTQPHFTRIGDDVLLRATISPRK